MHTISLYICLFVCFQESGILWVHQMTMLPGALLMGFYSHICPVDVLHCKIPNTVKVGESVYYSEPLLEYAPECKACEAYENFAKELIAYEG